MPFDKSDASMLRTAYELSAGMLSFVVAIGLGYWFGSVLDGWLGTAPWGKGIFLVFGVAAGVLNVVRTLRRALAQVSRPRPDGPGRGRP
jgi:ATP synthase protein I